MVMLSPVTTTIPTELKKLAQQKQHQQLEEKEKQQQ
jgi:hypothetical protein